MGWVWKDDVEDNSSSAGEVGEFRGSSKPSGDYGHDATRKVVSLQCRTEEVEAGKFIRKCEKTEQVFRDCVGRPNEMVESYKEYTEEDVTNQMVKGPFPLKPAENESSFPGLRNDFDAIERHFFSGIDTLFRAAEDMRSEFYNSVFGPPIIDEQQVPPSYGKPGNHIPNESFDAGSGFRFDAEKPNYFPNKKSDLDGDLSRFASDV